MLARVFLFFQVQGHDHYKIHFSKQERFLDICDMVAFKSFGYKITVFQFHGNKSKKGIKLCLIPFKRIHEI